MVSCVDRSGMRIILPIFGICEKTTYPNAADYDDVCLDSYSYSFSSTDDEGPPPRLQGYDKVSILAKGPHTVGTAEGPPPPPPVHEVRWPRPPATKPKATPFLPPPPPWPAHAQARQALSPERPPGFF